jgi:hypothetical protein
MMSTTDILLTITACTTSVIAVMTPILAYLTARNGLKTSVVRDAQIENKLDTDDQLSKIHTLVNNTLTQAQNENAALLKENQNQKEMITRLTPPPDSVITLNQKLAQMQTDMLQHQKEMDRLKQLLPPNPPEA